MTSLRLPFFPATAISKRASTPTFVRTFSLRRRWWSRSRSCYLTLDLAGVIHEANLTAATYLGVNRAQLLGRPFPRFLAPESSASFRAFLEKTATSDTRGTCEVTLPTAGGPPRCARLEGLAFADGAGAGRHCRLILHDITEHTRESAEIRRLLADSERNRRALLDSIEDLNLTQAALRASEADMAEASASVTLAVGSWS